MKNNNDQPVCAVDANGTKEWYLNGKPHRVDGPAVEWANGAKVWYLNDKYHRVDGPAVEYADGTEEWFLDGKFHRVDGPAVEWANGIKSWFLNGKHYCRSDQSQYYFAKGLIEYLEAVEELQNEK